MLPAIPTAFEASVVIGVAVEEAVVEGPHCEGTGTTAMVYTGTLRTQHSAPGMHDKAIAAGWVSRAKDITSKLRRRSVAVLTAGPNSASTSPSVSR